MLHLRAATSAIGLLAAAGSCSVVFLWVLLYAWTPQIYPVQMRLTGFGAAMSVNRIGQCLSPLVASRLLIVCGPGGPAIAGSVCCLGIALLAAYGWKAGHAGDALEETEVQAEEPAAASAAENPTIKSCQL
eukprot:gnl/TRDRNA2_/TRDRNA2_47341_c0_seq1.p1 gnl/TRDRNA2_/TRDRNA2_47341_c0~~gnl/TRDRNA2_/TRDRNA2_47341_c0_seq1.p1  ORF type:complete len:152 (-),score=15.94 gnl/TRDRNA2_/TRDRNA2_47341_c0_seq1:32-424(-)